MNQTVHDTTETAKDKAREVGSQAQEKAKTQVDSRTTDAGEQLQTKAESLHAVGDQLRERGDDTFAQVADKVAGWTEDMARYLRDADADRLLGDVEAYARRQPWAVAAGGALLGFAASRIVRAGTDRRQAGVEGTSRFAGYGSTDREIDLTRGYGTPAPATTYPDAGTAGYTAGYTGGSGYESFDDPVPPVTTVPDPQGAPLGDPATYPPTTGTGYGTSGTADVDR